MLCLQDGSMLHSYSARSELHNIRFLEPVAPGEAIALEGGQHPPEQLWGITDQGTAISLVGGKESSLEHQHAQREGHRDSLEGVMSGQMSTGPAYNIKCKCVPPLCSQPCSSGPLAGLQDCGGGNEEKEEVAGRGAEAGQPVFIPETGYRGVR